MAGGGTLLVGGSSMKGCFEDAGKKLGVNSCHPFTCMVCSCREDNDGVIIIINRLVTTCR